MLFACVMCAAVAAGLACPDCPTAREARHMVLHLDLLLNVAYAALPFAVTLALAFLIVRSISHPGATHGDDR